jgi:hypothetical protein
MDSSDLRPPLRISTRPKIKTDPAKVIDPAICVAYCSMLFYCSNCLTVIFMSLFSIEEKQKINSKNTLSQKRWMI